MRASPATQAALPSQRSPLSVLLPGVSPFRNRGHRGHPRHDLRIVRIFRGNLLVAAVSGFCGDRGQTGDGTGDGAASQRAESKAEDAALAVADPDLHLGAAVRTGDDDALPDQGLVQGVRAVAPAFA